MRRAIRDGMKTLTLSLVTTESTWIRNIALAVEETMPDATLEQIHAALGQLQGEGRVILSVSGDPLAEGYRKAQPFVWHHPIAGVDPRDRVSLSTP